MKKLGAILIFFVLQSHSSANMFEGTEQERRDKMTGVFIDGVTQALTGVAKGAKSLLTYPIRNYDKNDSKEVKKKECSKIAWAYYHNSQKTIRTLKEENNKLDKILKKHHLRYQDYMKVWGKPIILDEKQLKSESCSDWLFTIKKIHERNILIERQNNKIIKKLIKTNNIKATNFIKNKPISKNRYMPTKEKDLTERERAKKALLKQMQSKNPTLKGQVLVTP